MHCDVCDVNLKTFFASGVSSFVTLTSLCMNASKIREFKLL